jgi:hypothetical protein
MAMAQCTAARPQPTQARAYDVLGFSNRTTPHPRRLCCRMMPPCPLVSPTCLASSPSHRLPPQVQYWSGVNQRQKHHNPHTAAIRTVGPGRSAPYDGALDVQAVYDLFLPPSSSTIAHCPCNSLFCVPLRSMAQPGQHSSHGQGSEEGPRAAQAAATHPGTMSHR